MKVLFVLTHLLAMMFGISIGSPGGRYHSLFGIGELFAQSFGDQLLAPVVMLAGAGTVIALLFKLLMGTKEDTIKIKDEVIKAKDELIATEKRRADAETARALAEREEERKEYARLVADLESRKKSWEEIAIENGTASRDMLNFVLRKEGKPPLVPAAPVISESHSPSTAKQREDARIATMRASLAQVKLQAGLEPRSEPPPDDPIAAEQEPSSEAPADESGIELKVKTIVAGDIIIEKPKQ